MALIDLKSDLSKWRRPVEKPLVDSARTETPKSTNLTPLSDLASGVPSPQRPTQTATKSGVTPKPYNNVEKFKGQTDVKPLERIQKFLGENVKFPEICMDMDAQGRVFMKFTVEKDGSITNITVETNRTGCDEFVKEATRVLNKMPKWSPGEVGGDAKRTVCRLPFNFKIN